MSSISLRQPVLPYRDVATGETGYQFGVPAAEQEDPTRREFALTAGLDIVLVPERGAPRRVFHPILSAADLSGESTEPPKPHWAWTPVLSPYKGPYEPEVLWARVIPFDVAKGIRPLQQLPRRACPALGGIHPLFCTPNGLHALSLKATLFDLDHNITLAGRTPEDSYDMLPLTIGEENLLGVVHVIGDRVLAIEPSHIAIGADLWTHHLVRLVELFLCEAPAVVTPTADVAGPRYSDDDLEDEL
jgi:hypothetical protein